MLRTLSLSLSYRQIKWISIAALALLLIPLLCLGFYAAPAADDFSYGAPARQAFAETGTVLAAMAAAWAKTVESYLNWQGTFSAIFLMALQPAVFSEKLYFLTTFIMLAAVVAGCFAFCRAFFSGVLGLDKHLGGIAAALLCLLYTQLLPSPVQGLYWFNGSVYYVLFHGLLLLALALGIGLVKKGGLWRMALLCLLAVLIGGGNYVTALTAGILWAFAEMALIYIYIYKRNESGRGWKRILLPGMLLLAAFGISVLAPGNAVRQASQLQSCGALEAVLLSFKNGIEYSARWLSFPAVATMLFLAVIARPALRDSGFSFRCPALVSAFSYCLVSAMFCPPIYAMGNVGEPRIMNIIYLSWLLLLAVNVIWWLGWFCTRKKRGGKLNIKVLLLAGAVLAAGYILPIFSGGSYTSVLALGALRSGEAKAWHDTALRRFGVLNDGSIRDARIEPYPGQVYLLFYSDIVDDPTAWENVDMASFYGKSSVKFNTLD